jgi:hypothetical protein
MKIYILIFIILTTFNAIGKDNINVFQIINDSDKVLLKKTFNLDVVDKSLAKNLFKDNELASYSYLKRPKDIDVLLKKKGVDFNKINSLKIPKGWGVSYNNFFIKNIIPYKLEFIKENGKNIWHIKSKDSVTVYSPLLLANYKYLLKIDIVENSKGEINPYFCRYTSSFKWAGKKSFPEIKINKFGSYYSYLDMSNKPDGSVRLALAIKGDMKISKIALYPLNNAGYEFQSTIEGEILAISKVPSVKKTNYPDCYYTAKLRVHNILSGQAVPRIVQLVIPAFYNYKLTPFTALKKGDKLQLRICPFEKISKKAKSIQQADDLAMFEFEKYFVLGSQTLKSFSRISGIVNYADGVKYESGFEKSINPPISLKAEKARKEAIAQELKYINAKLKEISGKEKQINESFNKSWAETQKKYDNLDNKIWGKIGNGFFALPKNYTLIPAKRYFLKKNIAAIKILKEYLNIQGVQFIVQVIPSISSVAARVFNPQYAKYIDYESAGVTKELLDNGIEAVYTTDAIVKRAKDYEFCFFYPSDEHPAYGCQDVMTDLMLMRLKRFGLKPNLKKEYFSIKLGFGIYDVRCKYPEKVNIGTNKANTPVLTKNISYKKKFLNFSRKSKVLVVGNSYIQTPMKAGAYSSLLAMKSLYLPDNCSIGNYDMGNSGTASSIPIKLLKKKEQYLLGKKVCILPISVKYLTNQKIVNLKDIDLLLKNLTNRRELYKHKIISQNISLKPFKEYCRTWWLDFMNINPESKQLQFKKKGCIYTFAEFDIPGKMQKKEIVVFVKLVIFPKCSGQLVINGFSNYSEARRRNSEWQIITTKLAANTKKVKISFKDTNKDNVVIAVDKISIYQ